ncbi:MAG: LPS export ABC transporter periplasmic protein LptC [Pseudomonadota bacterium]|nr:LPS export ABC transporter periplasmic protein LptC [Pseudomonadota bacterium]
MSELARRDRAVRQHWAEPGSRHDRLVRIAKVALPIAAGVLVAFLAVAPFDRDGDISFILDKNQVENAPERMRVESARYSGADNQGRQFAITANQAVQQSSDVPIVDIRGMMARLSLAQGPVTIAADRARYNLDEQQVQVAGPVRMVGPDGYRLATQDLDINLKERKATGTGGVSGEMKLGRFEAGRLRADLGSGTIILDGGTRLKIVQGAVR